MIQPIPTILAGLLMRLPPGTTAAAVEQVRQAYHFAEKAHAGRRRESGELYVEHDLAVAHIVCDLETDTLTVVGSLLHDVPAVPLEKGEPDPIQKTFGDKVATLVASLRQLDQYAQASGQRDHLTLEKIRQAILSVIEGNIRAVVIRMADCLQDLRVAGQLPPERQTAVANDAINIYAPLANRLSIWQLKSELEDLAFRYLHPEEYTTIARHLREQQADRAGRIEAAIHKLQAKVDEAGIQAAVNGRPKHIYSIHRKMERKNVEFGRIYDVQGLRVIIEKNDPTLCYQVLGLAHSLWQPIPQEFDDYVARPKPNGYQSLHTAVMDDNGDTLEVQIRTRAMHEEAEKGAAAHWGYKEGRQDPTLNKIVQSLRQLLTTLREAEESADAKEAVQTELQAEHIYVFSPRGDVYTLPAGSTPIDFAYQIHTEVGHRCRGAKVNGKMVGLDHKLRSGDRVEIITAKRGGPNRDWMNESLGFAGSPRTRSKIRQWFRQQEREQNIQQGREVVNRELKRLGVAEIYSIEDIALALKYDDVEQFLAKVGFGDIQSAQIGGAISALQQKLRPDDELRQLLQAPPRPKGLSVRGVSGLHTNMAHCCNPIPPEPIIGYVTRGRGVTIHRRDCSQVLAIDEPERLIEAEWGTEAQTYAIPVVIKAYDRAGLMGDIANILKAQNVNLAKVKSITSNSVATVYLLVEVSTLDQLSWILSKVEKLSNVIEARRQRWTD
ncbi:MAG: bifunctional (p)ppGpp synthetase/guanosine-3',5'-bis(diphosphate) 3'-pyrophosphohydrolase [Chloroflexota bacterium]